MALGAHLSKLWGEFGDGKLVIYAKTKFIKSIVDKGLRLVAGQVPEGTKIEVLAQMRPEKDERVAKISAIMGGIEEVSVNG